MTQKYSNAPYAVPPGVRVYAIGDVHGHLQALRALEAEIERDLAGFGGEAAVVYLGDYIDRGAESRGVIAHLMARAEVRDGVRRHFLTGNHEDGMFEFLAEQAGERWLYWGGAETCASYGIEIAHGSEEAAKVEAAARLVERLEADGHRAFLEALELSVVCGDYLFAHAGVDPFKTLAEQTRRDLTCIREPFLSWHEHQDYVPLDKRVVHGHSIYKEPEAQPHRVSVDTGRYQGGKLTAAVIEGEAVRFLSVS